MFFGGAGFLVPLPGPVRETDAKETRVNRCFPSALVVHIQALQLAAEKMSQSWVVTAILGHFLQLDGF